MAERTRASRRGSTRRSSANENAEGRLSRDYSDEEFREPSEGYQGPEPTRGLYTCELVRISDHTSQDGNESVKWLFRLVDGSESSDGDDVSGWMDSQYTTENTAWREQQMLVALGVIKPNGKVNLGYDAIVKKAKPCTVKVGTERVIDDDGNARTRGRMQAFLTLRDSTGPTKKSRRAKDEDAEDVFDDEAEDGDDEDEEETPPARSRRSTARSRRKAAEPEPEEDEEDEDEEDEGGEEDYDPDELAAELTELKIVALKKRAREEFGVKISRGMDADDIIEAVLETLDEEPDDEDEPEEEPEPPKRRTRAGAAKARTTTRKRGRSEDPPF